ncbi:MAG: hypothetical protein KC583_03375, partial [Myxococcales bacterium]|nr:hypothetical protein [Myxococcales bacterium]
RLRPEEPRWLHLGGLLALSCRDPDEAERLLRKAQRNARLPARTSRSTLALGWALDLAGRRQEARICYKEALVLAVAPEVREAARAGLRRRFGHAAAHALAIDFQHADFFG